MVASSPRGALAQGSRHPHAGLQGAVGVHGLSIALLLCREGGKAAEGGFTKLLLCKQNGRCADVQMLFK